MAKRKSFREYRKREPQHLSDTAAHELGHVIAHVVTEQYFDSVWIRGVNEWADKWYDKDNKMAGCVRSWQRGGMKFDGKRVKCVEQDLDAETYLLVLLAGVAGEEVFDGRETPRSIIEVSRSYRLSESATDSYGDFRQAQKWVKHGVDLGYFHANEVWGVLQHYYNQAFHAVRSHKEFLLAAIPLLIKQGLMYNTAILTLWNGFYQITPKKKDVKKVSLLDVKDNVNTQETQETDMQFTELEAYVLHQISTGKFKGEIKDDQLQAYFNHGVGGCHSFAYIDGRRYSTRGLNKKFFSILYLFQRLGLVKVAEDRTLVATAPDDALAPSASMEVWKKDLNTVIEAFKKTVQPDDSDPTKNLSAADIKHVVEGSPVQDAGFTKMFDDLATTVTEINALKSEENGIRQAMDILGRDVSNIKDNHQVRLRFVLELSEPALKAAVKSVKKSYPNKPEKYDKMKKKEKESCGWNEWTEKWINDIVTATEAGTLANDLNQLRVLSGYLTAESAHAAWRIEAARRHPDQGGSSEASAAFGAIWDRVETMFPKAAAAA
jgi:hypothetical protein